MVFLYMGVLTDSVEEIVKNLNGLGCSGGYRLHWRGPQVERYSSTTTSGGRALS